MSAWAVFLDRDGTINEDVGLVSRPEQLKLIHGVGEALRLLQSAGAMLVLTTNQPVVARAIVDEAGLALIHERLKGLLAAENVHLDGIFYCPHHPETHHPEAADPRYRRECNCRKPKPGLLLDAAASLGIDMASSYMIGDSTRDIGAARAAGCSPILVKTGSAGMDGVCPNIRADAVVVDILAAANWILENRRRKSERLN